MSKQKLTVAFSGGRTSAFMAWWLKENKSDEYDIKFVFANTGQEHENTLKFVDQCDKEFGLNLIWLEVVVFMEKGEGSRHKIVTYETASRNGEPYEEVIKKYGIPNQAFNHCTKNLKLAPMQSWCREVGFQKAQRAVGIRCDEMDRMSVEAKKNRVIYPLISMVPTTKDDVRRWWSNMPFDLEIDEHEGNCVACFKKSKRKILTLIAEGNSNKYFDWCNYIEETYGMTNTSEGEKSRVFGRNYMSIKDLKEMAEQPFKKFVDTPNKQIGMFDMEWDAANNCSESCEVNFDE